MTRNVKLKAGIAITIADQNAPLGVTPSGAVIFEVRNVPDTVIIQQVWQASRNNVAGCLGHSFDWGS
ncbi:MAG: hypothetical protein KME11_04710 [Timaviella obliquedivisa GSE-PSE-MK23-08B]|jgi:hypothetical protein|nr:hypothetical protein [Timaviella obliquedivisa GSE-PSE-MK23-08B]